MENPGKFQNLPVSMHGLQFSVRLWYLLYATPRYMDFYTCMLVCMYNIFVFMVCVFCKYLYYLFNKNFDLLMLGFKNIQWLKYHIPALLYIKCDLQNAGIRYFQLSLEK